MDPNAFFKQQMQHLERMDKLRARDEKIKAQAKPASKPSLANLSQYDRAQSAPPGIIDGKFAGARGMASPSFLEQEPARTIPDLLIVKKIIDLLQETRKEHTAVELRSFIEREIQINPASPQCINVLNSLKDNPNVAYNLAVDTYAYEADYRLHNSDDVLSLLRRCPSGIAASKISDAYPNIMKDIDEMVAAKKILSVIHSSEKQVLLFPVDPKYSACQIEAVFSDLWRKTSVPDDTDMEKALQKANITAMALYKEPERAGAGGADKKKKRAKRPAHLTNQHLAGFFTPKQ